MKKFFAVCAVAAVLTACGGNSEGNATTDTTTVTNAAVDSAVVAPAINDTAAQGGTIQDTSSTVIEAPAAH